MTAQVSVPLVVNNVVQPASYFPGGLAMLAAAAGTFPTSLAVQILLPDGATYFTTTLTLAANGISATPVYLPPGKVQAAVGTGGATLNATLYAVPTNLN